MHTKTYSKLVLTLIIASLLITPLISVSAKKYHESGSIPAYPVTKKVIRFEESIPLSEELPVYPGSFYKVNVYGVDVGKGVILIDCGDDDLAPELYKSVTKAFNKPILAVYLTHYHSDHAGGGLYFQSRGIPVYAPESEAGPIWLGANVGEDIPSDFTYTGYMVDYTYETSELYPRFEIVPEPGHTYGAVAIEYRHGNRMYLFTMDTILPIQDNLEDLDLTYEITFNSAYQTYSSAPYLTEMQIETLYGMLGTIGGYDYVLTGHISTPMDAATAYGYIQYTIGTLEYFPYL